MQHRAASASAHLALALAALTVHAAGAGESAGTAADADAAAPITSVLEEVVVTATKRTESLSKVPISISAYTQEAMDQRDIRTISDIVAQTPGLNLGDQGSNGVGDRISIRGIDSNTGAGTTGVYIDDTPIQARSNPVNLGGTVFPQIFDLERVEVLRGPQGTLFGAGAEGGVVRFITPAPSVSKDSAYAKAELAGTQGGALSYELGGAFGGPLIDGVLGMRLSGFSRHDGGWVDRTAWQTGQGFSDVNWSDGGGARIALLWQPFQGLKLTPALLYQGSHQNDTPDYWRQLSVASSGRFVSGYQLRQPSTEHFTVPSLKIEADLGAVQLTSISSYFYRSESNVSDVTNYDIAGALGAVGANGENNIFPSLPGGALITDAFLGTTVQNVFTQELRLQNGNPAAALRWVAGLFFQNSRLTDSQLAPVAQLQNLWDQQQPGAFAGYYYDENCAADCSGLLGGLYEYTGLEHSRDLQVAAFGSLDWSITRQLIVNAGLRVEHTVADFVSVEDGPVNDGLSSSGGNASGNPVTPKLGLSFQQDEDTLYYGSIAKGYRPGGGNSHVPPSCGTDETAIGLKDVPASYRPDTTWSYELGNKRRFADGRVSVDASVYYVDWRSIQWYYFLPDCGYGIVFNLGNARSAGFDLELDGRITPQLTGTLSIGYTDARFKDTVILDQTPGDARFGTQVVAAGQTLGQAPWTIYSSLEYQFRLGEYAGYYLRAIDDFRSSNRGPFLYQNPNSAAYDPSLRPNPSTNQLDLRGGRSFGGWDLSVFINNLLDATPVTELSHYATGLDQNPSDPNFGNQVSSPIYVAAGLRPRTFGATAIFRY
jgi:outer membrane receptor protein involved in Fe transport